MLAGDLPCEGAVYLGRLEADETKKQERGAERIDDREERAQGEPEFAKGKRMADKTPSDGRNAAGRNGRPHASPRRSWTPSAPR